MQRQLASCIGRHDEFNADQVRFLRAVQSVCVQQRRLALDAFGRNAVERLFAPEQVVEVLELARGLTVS